MLNEVVLHVGMHKTGTTSIQAALDGFDDGHCRYAQLSSKQPNHSYVVRTIFGQYPELDRFHARHERSVDEVNIIKSGMLKALKSELELKRQKLIISGEGISTLPKSSIEQLKGFLSDHGASARVIAYVREPVSFVSSWFQQRVWGAALAATPVLSKVGYREKFEKFIELFGAENVEFVKYERAALFNGCVVSDFCSRAGIGTDLSGSKEVANQRLSEEAIKLLYILNQQPKYCRKGQNTARARTRTREILIENFPGRSFEIPLNVVLSLVEPADVEWMETIAGFSLREPGKQFQPLARNRIEANFEEFLNELKPETPQIIERCLKNLRVEFEPGTAPAGLLLLLFDHFLAKELSQ